MFYFLSVKTILLFFQKKRFNCIYIYNRNFFEKISKFFYELPNFFLGVS